MHFRKQSTHNVDEIQTCRHVQVIIRFNPCILKEDVRMPEVTWLSWIRLNNSRSPRVSVLSKAIYCEQGRALPSSATMRGMTAASMVVLKKIRGREGGGG